MTFFWNLNRDSARPWLVSEIGELYESAGAPGNENMAFDFVTLRDEVEEQYGVFDARFESLSRQGVLNGVGDNLETN